MQMRMLSSQASVVIALITFALLGVGTIALIAYLGARNSNEDAAEAEANPMDAVERALQLHREHMFLQKHPEWSGRDFRGDPSSPWHTDSEGWQAKGQSRTGGTRLL